MKIHFEKKYTTIAVYAVIVFLVCLVMAIVAINLSSIVGWVKTLLRVLAPIIWGIAFAYLLNPVMMWSRKLLTKLFCRKKPRPRLVRGLSVGIAALFMLAVIAALLVIVIPEITASIATLISAESIAGYYSTANNLFEKMQAWLDGIAADSPALQGYIDEFLTMTRGVFEDLISSVVPYLNNLLGGMKNFVIAVKDFCIGFIAMIYLLLNKELFLAQAKKLSYAILPKNICDSALDLCSRVNKTFVGFIVGKVIDSFIIGIMCFIGMQLLQMPYAPLVSVIVGVTNVIPFFGPFIGAIPSAFLILTVSPVKMLIFVVFIIALQQFDGNILGPKILGDSTGLPPFWVMFSIIVAGGLFGFAGMLCGVPVFAVIYMLIKEFAAKRLSARNMPPDTDSYRAAGRLQPEAVTEAAPPDIEQSPPADSEEAKPH